MKSRTVAECGRKVSEKDSHLSEFDMSFSYLAILQITRLYIQSIANPSSLAWMQALADADQIFNSTYGPQIAARALNALQEVRMSRRSMFNFNSPTCPSCCEIVTEHERRFMTALDCVRAGAIGQAKIELIMLCEGNDVIPALDAMSRLNSLIVEFLSSNIREPQCADSSERGCL